jgi:hypothetical protein
MAAGRGITEDELYRIRYGSMLHAASEPGVFDHPGATRAEVGEAVGLAPYPTDILLTSPRGLELVVNPA